jgi:hypothetical protein
MSEEKILYERRNQTVIFQLISVPGFRNYSFDSEGKDRLFKIRLIQGNHKIDYPFTYSEQKKMLQAVL